ncbi:MAG TPA: sigma 54-interacting transcriptional regulator, partial [Polyangia bacterium]|nr:sigma 54-interacting transcriptional regulator [Polyangia bacterium]
RIVAASNADLAEEVERGRFRRDLWFRLRVLHVRLPPLRERTGDVTLLARTFLERYARTYERPAARLSAASLRALEAHDWPGNVRELESLILRDLLLRDDDGDELHVASLLPAPATSAADVTSLSDFKQAKAMAVAEFERGYLRRLLACSGGNITIAARLSRKDRSALNKLVKKHCIRAEEFRSSRV